MGYLKAFLLAHAEKLLLAAVVLLAIWSISSNLFTSADKGVNREEINRDIMKIEKHLASDQSWVETTHFEKSKAAVESILNAYDQENWHFQGWDAPLYVPPPPRSKPVVLIAREDMSAPPAKYISKIDMPVHVQVKAGAGRVAIIFQEGPLTQWREDVAAAIYRKTVGVGREGADMNKVYKRQRERAGELTRPAENTSPVAPLPGAGAPRRPPSFSSRPPVFDKGIGGITIPPAAAFAAPSVPPAGMASPAKPEGEELPELSLTEMLGEKNAEAEAIKKKEQAAEEDLNELMDKAVKVEEKWVRIARGLKGVGQKPDIDAVLSEAPIPSGDSEASSRKWFYYLDKDVKENTIYRYKVVVYAKPKNLPEEILISAKEAAKAKAAEQGKKSVTDPYGYYHPLLRMGDLRMALPLKEFIKQVKSESPSSSAKAVPLKFPELEYQREIVKDWKGNHVDWWSLPIIGPDKTPEEAWKEISNATGFSQFAWSDYVLTPISTEFELKTVMTDQAIIEVKIVDSTGKTRKNRFIIKLPQIPQGVHEQYLDTEDQIAMRKMYRDVTPAPIGEEKSLGTNTYDFSTGWGLVDIRKCKITVGRFVWVNQPTRTKQTSKGTASRLRELDWDYMVIRELKGRGDLPPRYKVQLKYKRLSERPEYYEEIADVDWNPGIKKPQ